MIGRRQDYFEEDDQAEVSMSPLIDCVFLLLIFFLVSTMEKKENKDIAIRLPESVSAQQRLPTDDQTVIGITAECLFFLDGVETGIMELHQNLRHVAITDIDRQIRVDADAEAPLEAVIEAVDICQFNNLQDVVIRTYDEYYNKH